MTEPSDAPARARALTDFGSTLLVEAAAGTGKTSLLAGRIALLLASGAPPASIAAITFTRLAADELAGRVRETIDDLLVGRIPRPLQAVLLDGLSGDQHLALQAAAAGFDGLTATTVTGSVRKPSAATPSRPTSIRGPTCWTGMGLSWPLDKCSRFGLAEG